MHLTALGYVKAYAVALVVMLTLDLLWLGAIAKPFYDHHLGYLMREPVLWPAAVAFYAFFLLGLMVFVVVPSLGSGSVAKAAARGAFFGFITYQTYELTNDALVRDWPFAVVVVDIAWGMVVSALVSAATVGVARRWDR